MEPSIVAERSPEALSLRRRVALAASAFFFTPASARPLAALRIGVASVLLAQAWLLRAEGLAFFSRYGFLQGDLLRSLSQPSAPHISGLVEELAQLGVSEASVIRVACAVYVASLALLAAGFFTRAAAVAAWLLHWTLANSASPMTYGVDSYAHIFLFYLMWVPAGHAWSLDVALGRASPAPTAAARLGLRVMQLHLCLSYLVSGIEKASSEQWWNGEVLWRTMSLPFYSQFDMSWLARWPLLSQLAGLGALGVELGYCVFIWPRRTRMLWVAATVGLHLGIAVFLGLHIFGAMMCVLTPALFAVSPEPRVARPSVS